MKPADHERYISPDVIFEILSRTTSLETLDTCKCVSRNWKRLSYESSFMQLYCKRSNNLSGYFMQNYTRRAFVPMVQPKKEEEEEKGGRSLGRSGCIKCFPYNNDHRHDNIAIAASCSQGLVCCWKRIKSSNYRYYIGKPATQQWQALPNPKLRYETLGVGIMVLGSNPLHYKIVRLSTICCREICNKIRCEIFDSKSWAWTETRGISLPYDETIVHWLQGGVCVGKSIYWLTYHNNIVAFREDDDREQYSLDVFPLPRAVKDDECNNHKQLFDYKGGLGLVWLSGDSLAELWQLSDGRRDWLKKLSVDISGLRNEFSYLCPRGFCDEDTMFMMADENVIFYNIKDGCFKRVKIENDFRYGPEYFQFRSDSEPVRLRSC